MEEHVGKAAEQVGKMVEHDVAPSVAARRTKYPKGIMINQPGVARHELRRVGVAISINPARVVFVDVGVGCNPFRVEVAAAGNPA